MSDSIKYGMLYATVIMAVGTLIMQVLPSQLLKMFSASENMMSMGVMALRIISASFIFAGIDIVISSSLQALGYSIFSMFVSIARQLVILLPAAYIIARATHYSNVDYIWTAFIISEVVSLACSVFALKIAYKKVVAPLPE
ncbi:MAG: MATE family efflux transporter, partial [Oscillospiraceae bacterium]